MFDVHTSRNAYEFESWAPIIRTQRYGERVERKYARKSETQFILLQFLLTEGFFFWGNRMPDEITFDRRRIGGPHLN